MGLLLKDCVCDYCMLVASGIHRSVDVVQNPRMNVLCAFDVHVEHLTLIGVEASGFD